MSGTTSIDSGFICSIIDACAKGNVNWIKLNGIMELTLGTYQKNIMAVDLPHNIVDNTDKSESPAELGAEDIGELAITDPIEFEKIMNGDKDA